MDSLRQAFQTVTRSHNAARSNALPAFHPATAIREWGGGHAFRIGDALTGVCVFGATGSGKTTGAAKHLALGYMQNGFGGLVLCAKKEECDQWREWAKEAGRGKADLVVFEPGGGWAFNFLDWEAQRPGEGGGLTMNIVGLLDEIAGALASEAGKSEGGGDNQWFRDALHHMNMNLVELPTLAQLPITLPSLRKIVLSAPQSLAETEDEKWKKTSDCSIMLRLGDERTQDADKDTRNDFEECRSYWLREFPSLSEKTRGIIVLSFSMLVRPFITRPLRRLFGVKTNVTPEETFDGKIIIVHLPVQEYRLAGRLANLAWKYCFQVAVMRRTLPPTPVGMPKTYLRPVCLWSDEAHNFITEFDAEYQAVARSAGGCTVYLTQNRESFRRVLGNDDAVDALLGNLQAKFFCQNSSVDTNAWASRLFGSRWVEMIGRSGTASGGGVGNADSRVTASTGFTTNHQERHYIEPGEFATLRRGGERNKYQVECYVYNGGERYPSADGKEMLPFRFLSFEQTP